MRPNMILLANLHYCFLAPLNLWLQHMYQCSSCLSIPPSPHQHKGLVHAIFSFPATMVQFRGKQNEVWRVAAEPDEAAVNWEGGECSEGLKSWLQLVEQTVKASQQAHLWAPRIAAEVLYSTPSTPFCNLNPTQVTYCPMTSPQHWGIKGIIIELKDKNVAQICKAMHPA